MADFKEQIQAQEKTSFARALEAFGRFSARIGNEVVLTRDQMTVYAYLDRIWKKAIKDGRIWDYSFFKMMNANMGELKDDNWEEYLRACDAILQEEEDKFKSLMEFLQISKQTRKAKRK